jgi:imidazolonepropionase-like amidohydrolase
LLGLNDAGTLSAGKRADAVLLDGDPFADITAYKRPAVVIQAGRVVSDHR